MAESTDVELDGTKRSRRRGPLTVVLVERDRAPEVEAYAERLRRRDRDAGTDHA